jgi:hypothetical protein
VVFLITLLNEVDAPTIGIQYQSQLVFNTKVGLIFNTELSVCNTKVITSMNTISRYYNATYLLQLIMVSRYQSQMYQICGVVILRNSISPYTVFLHLQMHS